MVTMAILQTLAYISFFCSYVSCKVPFPVTGSFIVLIISFKMPYIYIYPISIAIVLLPPGRMDGVYGAVMDNARAVPRNKKLEVSYNSEDVLTNSGTIGQCAMEENTAFVGATLNDGSMRIKYVQSGVYRFVCLKDPCHFPYSHVLLRLYYSI